MATWTSTSDPCDRTSRRTCGRARDRRRSFYWAVADSAEFERVDYVGRERVDSRRALLYAYFDRVSCEAATAIRRLQHDARRFA